MTREDAKVDIRRKKYRHRTEKLITEQFIDGKFAVDGKSHISLFLLKLSIDEMSGFFFLQWMQQQHDSIRGKSKTVSQELKHVVGMLNIAFGVKNSNRPDLNGHCSTVTTST